MKLCKANSWLQAYIPRISTMTYLVAMVTVSILSWVANGYSFSNPDYGGSTHYNGNGHASNVIGREGKKGEGQCGCMQGPSGPPGVPGVPGYHGHRGQDGNKGDKGESGNLGPIGPKGDMGAIGPDGQSGHRGKKGYPGEPGLSGEKGDPGPMGARGLPGIPGAKGEKGEPARPAKKVAFSVIRSTKLGPVLQDTPITFDKVVTNLGDGFDEYSSHFVCRLNGTYVFMTHILGQNNKDVYAWIMLNNKHKVPLHGDGRAGYGTGSQTIILHMQNEDHVWIQLSKDSGLLNDYSTFSGYMLYDEG